jgi:uroporphyrinogen III methyltransferase/synthase
MIKEKPLLGQKVIVTRPRESAHALSNRLRGLGAQPIEIPTISIEPLHDYSELDRFLENLNAYDWIIFTSMNGVKYFFEHILSVDLADSKKNKDYITSTKNIKIAAIGPATASALQEKGIKADFIPKKYLASEIGKEIGNVRGKKILLPRADIASKVLTETLREKGAVVDEIAVYRTVPNAEFGIQSGEVIKILENGEVDWITFTSASALHSFTTLIGGEDFAVHSPITNYQLPMNVRVACIGPVTAKACQKAEIPVQVIAEEHTIQGLVKDMVKWMDGDW